MRKPYRTLLFAAALSAPVATTTHAASVHSAAGVVPPLPQSTEARSTWADDPTRLGGASVTSTGVRTPSTPPPLPGQAVAQAPAPPAVTAEANPVPSVALAPTPSVAPARPAAAPPAPQAVAAVSTAQAAPAATPPRAATVRIVSFEDALEQEVIIDVVDMRFEDLLQKLVPNGWRMRTQNIDPATLERRVDLTAQATRGEVLYELLAQSSLAAKPFDGFAVPLLLITNR